MRGIALQCDEIAHVWLLGAPDCYDEIVAAFALVNAKRQRRGKGLKHLLALKRQSEHGVGEGAYLFSMALHPPRCAELWNMGVEGRISLAKHPDFDQDVVPSHRELGLAA